MASESKLRFCRHCLFDIIPKDGAWVLAWGGPDDDTPDTCNHEPGEAPYAR